jgi:hypothetical protein
MAQTFVPVAWTCDPSAIQGEESAQAECVGGRKCNFSAAAPLSSQPTRWREKNSRFYLASQIFSL